MAKTIIRNLLILAVLVTAILMLVFSNGLTEFYNTSAFESATELEVIANDTEHRGNVWRNHNITVKSIDSSYTYKGAVLDLSQYEDADIPCISGKTEIPLRAFGDCDVLKHLLVINPANHEILVTPYAGLDIKIYTDSEYAIELSQINDSPIPLLPAEQFYKAEAAFKGGYGSITAILRGDFDYFMYHLVDRNGIFLLIGLGLCLLFLIVRKSKNPNHGLFFDENNDIQVNQAVAFYIAGVMLCIGIASLSFFMELLAETETGSYFAWVINIVVAISILAAVVMACIVILVFLTERKMLVAIGHFISQLTLALLAGVLSFGLGLVLCAIAERYKIVITVYAIAMVIYVGWVFFAGISILLSPFGSLFKTMNALPAALASGSNADKDCDVSNPRGGNADIPMYIYDKNGYKYIQIQEYSDRAKYRGPNGEIAIIYYKHAGDNSAVTDNNVFTW